MCNGLECITPEQLGMLIFAVISFAVAVIGFLGWLFSRYIPRYLDKRLEEKDERDKLERKKQEVQIQAQLDETQANRETIRLFFSELSETRKDDALIRASYERRELAQIEAMAKVGTAMQGIEASITASNANAALTLELLKAHTESDESMAIGQERIKSQNEKTHMKLDETQQKLNDISSDLAAVLQKLESITVGRAADRRVIDEIEKQVAKTQEEVKTLTEIVSKEISHTITIDVSGDDPIVSAMKEEKKEESHD